MHFTDLDFLLNTRRFKRAGVALMAIRKALRQRYHKRMLAEDADGGSSNSLCSDMMANCC